MINYEIQMSLSRKIPNDDFLKKFGHLGTTYLSSPTCPSKFELFKTYRKW